MMLCDRQELNFHQSKVISRLQNESMDTSQKEGNNYPNRQAGGNQRRRYTRNSNRKGLCASKRQKNLFQ